MVKDCSTLRNNPSDRMGYGELTCDKIFTVSAAFFLVSHLNCIQNGMVSTPARIFRKFAALLAAAAFLLFPLMVLPPAVKGARALNSVPPVGQFPEDLRFEHLTAREGLSQSAVYFVYQDRQGFLWLGTQDGLHRYDGYHFTVFLHDPDNPNSLSNNAVLCMLEDSQGMFWLGTWGGGLNRYDPKTGIFTRYQHDPNNPDSLQSSTVSALYEDHAGRLWAGTMGGGLNLVDRQNGRFIPYTAEMEDPNALSSDYIGSILEDASGMLWLGTGGLGAEGYGLNRFDPQTGSAVRYLYQPNDPATLSSNTISAIVRDPQGYLWVATGGYGLQGRGLNRFDPKTGQVVRFIHDSVNPGSLSSNNLMSLYLDPAGTLWIGTWGGGLDRLDIHADQPHFIHYRYDPYDPFSINANTIWSVFQDRSGILWVGSALGGLNKINPAVQRFHLYRNNPGRLYSIAGNAVGPLLEDRRGGLWVGTRGFGLERLDRSTGIFTHFPANPDDPLRQQENTYQGLLEDHTGDIWAATMSGLANLDQVTGAFTYYSHDPQDPTSLSDDLVNAVVEDSRHRLWVGTQNGLDLFDRQNQRFVHIDLPENPVPVLDLAIDHQGQLWMGTWGKGLFRVDLASLMGNTVRYVRYNSDPGIPDSLGDDIVWDIYEDSAMRIWLVTGRGLDHLDADSQKFTHYSSEDGLMSNSPACIVEDRQDILWISTNQGLSRFDRTQAQFRTFDARDGLQGDAFYARSCLRTKDGTLFFGGAGGLSSFDPEKILDNPFPPPVVVTGFRIFNNPAELDLSGRTPIRLSYQQDFITFEFVALDYHIPEKNRYRYKLEGFDSDWIRADLGRYASYTNLPGGDYVFHVRGSNNDGVWNTEEAAIPIHVETPFWETWWFRSGMMASLVLVIALGVRAYLINIRVQNRRLETLVEQRTVRLRQTNERLQQEIEQREKVEAALAQKAADEAVAVERSRLARELHDAVTQTLFSASLIAEVLPDLWNIDAGEALRSTDELRQLTRGALAEMRALLLELRPAALVQARYEDLLRQLTEAVMGRARLPVSLTVEGSRKLPPEVQVALYRIAQEALNNIVKYAKAGQVCIELHMSTLGLLLSIQDNGVGFDPSTVKPTSMGLRIMNERAEGIGADLTVTTAPGKGTIIEVTWNDPDTKELV